LLKCGIIENVLLDPTNDSWVICDFGFAAFTIDAKVQLVAGLKQPRAKGITVRYAAPEVFAKKLPFYIF
jgi:serine/threonine protein kinase